MRRRVYVEEDDGSGWALAILVIIAIIYWDYIVPAAMLAFGVWCGYKLLQIHQARKNVRVVNDALLSANADYQNMMYNQGDPIGIYGNYDLYTMPVSSTMPASEHYVSDMQRRLDDYDDGMRNWK